MIVSTPPKAPVLAFGLPFEGKLNPKNRWVILANLMPWDTLGQTYNKPMCSDNGRPALAPRLVLGALFVKHMLNISDEETILQIQENVYLQYFVGLEVFQETPIFDPSLFVAIRKRLGEEGVTALENAIVAAMRADRTTNVVQEKEQDEAKQDEAKQDEAKQRKNRKSKPTQPPLPPKKDLPHHGHLKIDTTVAPQKIKFPTDLDLLNTARQKTEHYVDLLCQQLGIPRENYRTYRRKARMEYLKVAKTKRKTKKILRAALRKQLAYVKRNLLYISTLITQIRIDGIEIALKGWRTKDIEEYTTIQTLYEQQQTMYDTKTNRCDNRIVSISQPYVRPIVRGKAHINTEFGAKIAIATIDGISTIDRHTWNAYHDSTDLQTHIDCYTDRFQCYPECINSDQIYHTKANHQLAKHYGIRFVGKKLGRVAKIDQTPQAKRAIQRERNQRNVVEGKIGQAKNRYGLDSIAAKTDITSVVWTKCCLIATNLVRWLKDVSLHFFTKVNFSQFLHNIYFLLSSNFNTRPTGAAF